MLVNISELPQEIQKKIPYSIRTHKTEYELDDLPPTIRTIIFNYIESEKSVSYGIVFDCTPQVSEYGDLSTITNLKNLILEYLKNYFLVSPEDYPFDPTFGTRLKTYLNMRDTSLRQKLLSGELTNIIGVISADLGTQITIEDTSVSSTNNGDSTSYELQVKVKINNQVISVTLG